MPSLVVRAASAVAMIAALVIPAIARADDKDNAQRLMSEGYQLSGEGEYVPALEKFRQANAIYPSPKLLLNIGTTLRQLGRNAEAADAYEKYLADPGADPARALEVRRVLQEIATIVAEIRVHLAEPGARLLFDGHVLETRADDVVLRCDAGQHTVVAEKQGLTPAVYTFVAKPGDHLKITLHPSAGPARIVEVEAPPTTTQRNVAFAVAGVGLVGVGVASIYGVAAKSKNDDAKAHCWTATVCDATGVKLGDEAKTNAAISTVAFIAGGAALATGVVLYFTSPTFRARSPEAQTALVVRVGPRGAVVSGSF